MGVQPPGRGPVRRERAGPAVRLLLRAGAGGRRGGGGGPRAGAGRPAVVARPGRASRTCAAAQHYAREELGLLRVDDLPPVDHTRLPIADPGAERWEVTLAGPDGPVVVTVESRPSPETVHLTCQAVRPGRVRTWHRLSLLVPSAAVAR